MFMIFNQQFLFLALISMAYGMPSLRRQVQSDKICGEVRSVLCVNSSLMSIRTATISIERLANDIERHINKDNPIIGTLHSVVKSIINSSRPPSSKSKYIANYSKQSNIDKEFLGHLLEEMHYATNYYYNSIDNMKDMDDFEGFLADRFQEIQSHLGSDVICQYRSILAVYSLEWSSASQVNLTQYPINMYAPDTIRNLHALLIAKLLKEWMETTRDIIDNLHLKYY